MQKNKIVLALLMGLFSLNATASAWMPSKDNALVYAAGGLAVVTGVLAYKVCQLTKHVASLDEARKSLQLQIKSKAEAVNLLEFVTKSQLQGSLNALKNEQTQIDVSGLATKEELEARAKILKDAFSDLTIRSGTELAGGVHTLLENAKEKIHQSTNAAIEVQRQTIVEQVTKALEAHKKANAEALKKLDDGLTNTLATNDAARQKGVIDIKKQLKTFVLLERLDETLQPIKEAADKAKTDAALAKSEAEKGTRLSQSAKDEVRELGEQVRNLAKSIATNATAKADAEKPTDAPAAAAATPAAASANA